MSEPFAEDLSKVFKNVTVSRKWALQVLGGVIAIAVPARVPRSAEAGKNSKPPLAVASAVLVDITPTSLTTFTYAFKGAVVHKESGKQFSLQTPSGSVTATATGDRARKEVLSLVRFRAVETLRSQLGLEVPEDRNTIRPRSPLPHPPP
jgi:hypothetical protein